MYLSLDSVEEILPDFPEWLCEFQDGVVWVFAAGNLTDVHNPAGATLRHTRCKVTSRSEHVVIVTSLVNLRVGGSVSDSPGWWGRTWSD